MRTHALGIVSSSLVLFLASCGDPMATNNRSKVSDSNSSLDAAAAAPTTWETESAELRKDPEDAVVSTVLVKLDDSGEPLALTSGTVDMEVRRPVTTMVGAEKYLRVEGQLRLPESTENRMYSIGCLDIELRDNVYYRERTWIRVSSTGMRGNLYSEFTQSLAWEAADGWKDLPRLPDSTTLIQFEPNSIKRYKGKLCLRLDLTNAPAQKYSGEIVVQYLRPQNPMIVDTTAPANIFKCSSDAVALKAGQSAPLAWQGFDPAKGGLTFALSSDPANVQTDRGRIAYEAGMTARYTAPATVTQPMKVMITAKAPGGCTSLPAYCVVNLIPDQDIGIRDDGETRGLVGNVYRLPVNTAKLPNFDAMQSVAQIVAPNLDVPERNFSVGFPGVRDLFEWFGVRFVGTIEVPADGEYEFSLRSDDGSILYINDNKVIDNDGLHATRTINGKIWLKKGSHKFRVDYYQGPRFHITLQLLWRAKAADPFVIVPPEAFKRPLQ